MTRSDPFCNRSDYILYLNRYTEGGTGEPLGEEEFCQLQEEMLDLLADRAAGGQQTTEQRKRIRHLRKLLLTDI